METMRIMLLVLVIAIFSSPCPIEAQEVCRPPAVLSRELGPNIFSPQQEIDLADALAEQVQRELPTTDDPRLTAYLARIGQLLVKQLPPTELRFRYFLVDAPVPDAFSLPGGRIYVSRKMVVFAGNEEEIAGVLAHEIGHIVTHHTAIDMTRLLREVLGITKVSHRSDVFEKFNLLMENWRRNPQAFREVRRKEQTEQVEADQVAFYALARAA